ncbi:hypothetical protein DFH09DRAFT_1448470 [Mycena vulgaris]|nr:hypothetical protein DFH09DRAFT_1448470 [Mycena vulgaris]
MYYVPLELLQTIVAEVGDHSTLLTLRLASQTCNFIAEPMAFRVLTVRDSVESAEALACLQNCGESITNAVKEIVFKGDTTDSWIAEDETSGEEGRDALSAAFSDLPKFPNLHTLGLDFHALAVFAALAASPPPSLVSLTLNSIIAKPDTIYASAGFQRIFQPLTTLHLSTLSDTYGDGAYARDPLNEFWDDVIPRILHSAPSLTALTISSDQPFGLMPLDSVHLPHLASLTFHNFVVDVTIPWADIVEFIVRHGASLTHLALDECNLLGDYATWVFPRPWHVVLRRFEQELPHLRTFELTTRGESRERGGEGVESDDDNDREGGTGLCSVLGYITLEVDYGFIKERVGDPVGTEAEDAAALQSLMSALEARCQ